MSIRPHLPALALCTLLLALGACESVERMVGGGTTPVDPASFDGTWTGTTSRTGGGERNCPGRTPFVVTITGGQVHGEVRSARDRAVTTARFEGVLDADGRFAARIWYGGAQNDLSGTFSGDSYSGQIRDNNDCVFSLRLSRR